MTISLIKAIQEGGCYWKKDRVESPGHSIVIPNGTPFHIKLDGTESNRLVLGTCHDGYFVLPDGKFHSRKYRSANEVVTAVRGVSSNAFEHLGFQIEGSWKNASHLREMKHYQLNDAEEIAFQLAHDDIRRHSKPRALDDVQLNKAAAEKVSREPQWMERGLAITKPLEL